MTVGFIAQTAGIFTVTNIDDLLMLALFFGQVAGRRGGASRVVIGQYLGFVAILAMSLLGALGAALLPESVIPYLGLLPLLLGLRGAWQVWRDRGLDGDDDRRTPRDTGPAVLTVAAVTLANGADNIGVYVPVFAAAGTSSLIVYGVVFLALVAIWCVLGRFFATRPVIACALGRWGHILFPLVLIAIGLLILIEGGAFAL